MIENMLKISRKTQIHRVGTNKGFWILQHVTHIVTRVL